PAVLGELVMGILLAALAFLPLFSGLLNLSHDPLISGIAEIGVLLLLFQTGLKSNLREMQHVGLRALIVASVGVILPFAGGYLAAKILIPGISGSTCLFLGATLTATSVGITSRVFQDLNILNTKEAKIVLGASVIDDVLGLLILAIVGGIVAEGHVEFLDILILCSKALAFFALAIFLARPLAPYLGSWAARVHHGIGMKTTLALVFCGAFAYAAWAIAGLA
ncbi:MAG: cation:proton antiporter, partial [Parachlamydiales bacterium]